MFFASTFYLTNAHRDTACASCRDLFRLVSEKKTFEVSQLGSHFEGKARLKFCVEPYLFKKKNLLWYILLGADGKVTTE